MVKVVVVGGGWSGCGAAIAAAKAGADVTLLERADMLLGTGLVGGYHEETTVVSPLPRSALPWAVMSCLTPPMPATRHKLDFPGHKHASLYDVAKIEPAVEKKLTEAGVKWHLEARFTDVVMDGKTIKAVKTEGRHHL